MLAGITSRTDEVSAGDVSVGHVSAGHVSAGGNCCHQRSSS